MDIDKKLLGQRIKNIRVNRQETMEQFAKKLNSGKSNVSKWESGKNVPNDITLKKIAELGEFLQITLLDRNARKS
ncbi:helix-turn-helix domain-containing protein [Salinicoccus sp. CNSTN-B1]